MSKDKMLRYILAILFAFICFAHPAAAQENATFIKNAGKYQSRSGEQVYLVRLSKTMIMPHRVRYIALDQQGRILSTSPSLGYAHSVDCSSKHSCVFYDLWHIMPAKNAAWHMTYERATEQRQSLITAPEDAAQKKLADDLIKFVESGSKNIFETPLLKNIRTADTPDIYGTHALITNAPILYYLLLLIFSSLFSIILFHQNTYHSKVDVIKPLLKKFTYWHLKRRMGAVHALALLAFTFLMFHIPLWCYALILTTHIVCMRYAYIRASRLATQRNIRDKYNSENPTPLNG